MFGLFVSHELKVFRIGDLFPPPPGEWLLENTEETLEAMFRSLSLQALQAKGYSSFQGYIFELYSIPNRNFLAITRNLKERPKEWCLISRAATGREALLKAKPLALQLFSLEDRPPQRTKKRQRVNTLISLVDDEGLPYDEFWTYFSCDDYSNLYEFVFIHERHPDSLLAEIHREWHDSDTGVVYNIICQGI